MTSENLNVKLPFNIIAITLKSDVKISFFEVKIIFFKTFFNFLFGILDILLLVLWEREMTWAYPMKTTKTGKSKGNL